MKLPLLLVVATLAVLLHKAAPNPLPQEDDYDDYYDDYDYGEEDAAPAETPEHHHHHGHHDHGAAEETIAEEPVYEDIEEPVEPAMGSEESTESSEEEVVPVPISAVVPPRGLSFESGEEVTSDSPIIEEDLETTSEEATTTTVPLPPHAEAPPAREPEVDFSHLGERCTQAPETGLCRGYFPMFYFDPESRSCRQFVYGGCRGNENQYKTTRDCYSRCYPQGLNGTHVSPQVQGRSSASQRTYLTLGDGTGASVLTFVGQASAKVNDVSLDDFYINGTYQLEFHFRTDSPHGLVAFLRQKSVPGELEGMRIQQYVYLKKGHLALTHIFGNTSETFVMKRGGLQAGNWHSAVVRVDSGSGDVVLEVDGQPEYFSVDSLKDYPHYTSGRNLEGFATSMWIGGVFNKQLDDEDVVLGFVPFHGCLQDFKLLKGDSKHDLDYMKNLRISRHEGVTEHCRNNCGDRWRNHCSSRSHCVEHFDHSTCSCFNSGQSGRRCTDPEIPVLTLAGDGYVVHRLYEWMDRVQSYSNIISVTFRTKFPDSILFYAASEYPKKQHIAASITRTGSIYIEVDLGCCGPVSAEVGENMEGGLWHTLTLVHQHETIKVFLDHRLEATMMVPGKIAYFHLDPNFYIGNAPDLPRYCALPVGPGRWVGEGCQQNITKYFYDVTEGKCRPFSFSGCGGNVNSFDDEETCMDSCLTPGLRSFNPFIGCMESVYYNDVMLLLELQLANKTTRYHGTTEDTPISYSCEKQEYLPVTFSTEEASVRLYNERQDFRVTISFKPTTDEGVLASGYVVIGNETTEWELWHVDNYVTFYIHDGRMVLKPNTKIRVNHWQYVDVRYDARGRLVKMRLNHKYLDSKRGELGNDLVAFSSEVTIGDNVLQLHPGFVGCIRKLELGGEVVPARAIVGTPQASKDVILDNCKVLSPCERPGACKHGGQCTVENQEVKCNCSGTGYTGNKCHFPLYLRSCEQYRQVGYSQDGVYKVDVDGSGPLPPAFVNCTFNDVTRKTTTKVVHNLPNEYLVRHRSKSDVRLNLQYRDFSHDMMASLIAQSKYCEQTIRYDCRRSPLHLSTHTWFSSPHDNYFTNLGSKKEGLCRCKEVRSCDGPDVACNCDMGDGMARSDVGVITDSQYLPVTGMTFLQDKRGAREDTEGKISLGSLKCYEEVSARYTVSFTEPSSFLEIPAWREGSFSISFKTTSSHPVVAYQPATHPGQSSFMIAIIEDNQLEFQYRHRDHVQRAVLLSPRPLNQGDWHRISIQVYDRQVRFLVDSEEKIMDLDFDVELDGSMYLGAIPDYVKDDMVDLEGLVGCIRGLTLNDEVINMKSYIRASAHGVLEGCTPSCDPNPCYNGARCIEKWGSYECVCKNPLAHSGKNCEKNINQNAITFQTHESRFKYFTNDTESLGTFNLLNNTFKLNFRTHDRSALILFAHDAQHNFVQLHLASEDKLVFLFNHGKDVLQVEVSAEREEVFNEGQSVQVMVKRTDTCTTLIVYTHGRFFNETIHSGLLLLQADDYEQFPFGTSQPLPEMVYYPHSVTRPSPYFQAFIGSANDPTGDVRSAFPGLVGCLRGLQVGSQDVPLAKLVSGSRFGAEGIRQNCKLACDLSPCHNGGTCTEDFKNFNNFHCDCIDTSYKGASCAAETGYTFDGAQWLSKASTNPVSTHFTLDFAFSASKVHSNPQVILLLKSTDESTIRDYLLVGVGSDGSLVVEAQFSGLDADNIHGAKLTPGTHLLDVFDGYRHHVVVTRDEEGWTLIVDGKVRETYVMRPIYDHDSSVRNDGTYLYLGGLEAGVDDRLTGYDNFHGCISNVRIQYPEGDLHPMEMTLRRDLHISRSSSPPKQSSCSMFAPLGAPSILRGPGEESTMVLGKKWKPKSLEREHFEAVVAPSEHPPRDTVMDNVVPAVSCAIFIIAFIIIAILLVRMRNNKKKEMEKLASEEEKEMLLNGRKPRRGPSQVSNVFTISEKTEMVPLKSAPEPVEEQKTAEPINDAKFIEVPLVLTPDAADEGVLDAKPAATEDFKVCSCSDDDTSDDSVTADGRNLSWDKSADDLPLIIAQPAVDGNDDSSSSESSFECSLDLNNDDGTASPTLVSRRDSGMTNVSTQAHRDSMPNIDEAAESQNGEPVLVQVRPLGEPEAPLQQKEEALQEPFQDVSEPERPTETQPEIVVNEDAGAEETVKTPAIQDECVQQESLAEPEKEELSMVEPTPKEPVVEPHMPEPPVVEPPVVEPPIPEPPMQEPVVELPLPEPNVVEPPTSEPVVEPPMPEPPVVEPPMPEPPVVEPPMPEPPVVEPPMPEPPVVELSNQEPASSPEEAVEDTKQKEDANEDEIIDVENVTIHEDDSNQLKIVESSSDEDTPRPEDIEAKPAAETCEKKDEKAEDDQNENTKTPEADKKQKDRKDSDSDSSVEMRTEQETVKDARRMTQPM